MPAEGWILTQEPLLLFLLDVVAWEDFLPQRLAT
jgi:hypothetical protein